MKAKTIKAILRKNHNKFVDSIKDETVRELVEKNSIVTGGAIVSMLLNEEVNDFDYYFTNKETTLKVAEYYVSEFNKAHDHSASVVEEEGRISIFINSAGVAGDPEGHEVDEVEPTDLFDDEIEEGQVIEKFNPVFLSQNAISLTGKTQLVLRFYGDADEIHTNYDFVHATCYWRSENNHLSLPQEALEAIITKELIYRGSKYPLASVIRTRKFIQRGWSVNAGQYLKMILQLNELDLFDLEVLKDQLTGVDAFYFEQVIVQIQAKQESDPEFKFDSAYLCEVIDHIF